MVWPPLETRIERAALVTARVHRVAASSPAAFPALPLLGRYFLTLIGEDHDPLSTARSIRIQEGLHAPRARRHADSTGQPTPRGFTVKKTKHDIILTCKKDGYQEATYFNKSGAAGATFGNIILGGGIGWAIASASGSDNKYESPMNIALVRLSGYGTYAAITDPAGDADERAGM
jgi:hypothetical protein